MAGDNVLTQSTRFVMRIAFPSILLFFLFSTQAFAQLFLPIYSADPARRARQLGVTSENLRAMHDEWERIWFLDQPSGLTPFPNRWGQTPFVPRGGGVGGGRSFGFASPGYSSRRETTKAPTRVERPIVDREERVRRAKERDEEELRKLFALANRAEAKGKTSVAITCYRMVANGTTGKLKAAASERLAALANTNGP